MMARWHGLWTGIGVGMLAMYLLDPEHGRVRRTRAARQLEALPNQLKMAVRQGHDGITVGWRGLRAGWRAFVDAAPATDDSLAGRVRRGLKRVLRDASLIEVHTQAGRVTLTGSVHAEDAAKAVQCALTVSGVLGVDNHLEFRH